MPEWLYFIIMILGILFAEIIEMAIAGSFVRVVGDNKESWKYFTQYWLRAHVVGIIVQLLFLAVVSRLRPKK
jgi:hypothetical protein